MTFQINRKKNDANIMVFWVINKGSNVWNQDGIGSVAGDLSNPADGSCRLRAMLHVILPIHALIPLHFN